MGEAAFHAELEAANLVALVNWTMIPNMTAIFTAMTEHVLPKLPRASRTGFSSSISPIRRNARPTICAPRSTAMAQFEQFGRVTLGLNLKEAQQVVAGARLRRGRAEDEAGLRAIGRGRFARSSASHTVVVHPTRIRGLRHARRHVRGCPGRTRRKPLITTGAGDHFNAGFTHGPAARARCPRRASRIGVCTSGHYVRTGESPTLADLETFLANWR